MTTPCENTTALTTVTPSNPTAAVVAAPSGTRLPLEKLALHAFNSGMFKKLPNASAAVMVLQMGRDVGMSDTAALTNIHFFEGKPTMSGNALWSLVLAHPEFRKSHVVAKKTGPKQATIRFIREVLTPNGTPERILDEEWAFTEEDAKRAGLVGKDNWRKYPTAMLFNRAVSTGVKMFAAHVTMGYTVYTPDELGLKINSDGGLDNDTIDAEFSVATNSSPINGGPNVGGLAAVEKAIEGSGITLAQVCKRLGIAETELGTVTPGEVRQIEKMVQEHKALVTPK